MKTNHIPRLRMKALLMALALAALPPLASADDDPTATDNQAPAEERTFQLDLETMRADIASGLPVEVLVGDLGWIPLRLLEFEVFAPDAKQIIHVDAERNVLATEPFAYWAFHGTGLPALIDDALLTMDDRGLYGHVDANGTRYHFAPADESHVLATGEQAAIRVYWRPSEGDGDAAPILGPASSYSHKSNGRGADPNTSPGGTHTGGGGCSMEQGFVEPYADARCRNKHSNYATRIANAFSHQYNMWKTEACIYVLLMNVVAGPNYSSSSDCSEHLQAFRNSVRHRNTEIDAVQLFTGQDISSRLGCGRLPSNSGQLANDPASLVEAVDHSWRDYYDPDEAANLGAVSGHELAHNWGERDHHYDKRNGKYNLMASGTDPDKRGFWFTALSEGRIRQATQGRL